jgi:hypothetical protein
MKKESDKISETMTWVLRAPRENEPWQQFSAEIGAEFIRGSVVQNLRSDRVVAKQDGGIITLDTYEVAGEPMSTTYTRIRAPCTTRDGFQFKIYRTGALSKFRRLLGHKPITTGDPTFDREFVVTSNDEFKARILFANPRIRALIEAQPEIYFTLTRSELHCRCEGRIEDVTRLKALFLLCSETLTHLSDTGSTLSYRRLR